MHSLKNTAKDTLVYACILSKSATAMHGVTRKRRRKIKKLKEILEKYEKHA